MVNAVDEGSTSINQRCDSTVLWQQICNSAGGESSTPCMNEANRGTLSFFKRKGIERRNMHRTNQYWRIDS